MQRPAIHLMRRFTHPRRACSAPSRRARAARRWSAAPASSAWSRIAGAERRRSPTAPSAATQRQLASCAPRIGDLRRCEKDMVIDYEKADRGRRPTREQWRRRSRRDAAPTRRRCSPATTTPTNADRAPAAASGSTPTPSAREPVIKQLEAGGYDNASAANRMLDRAKAAIAAVDAARALDEPLDARRRDSAKAARRERPARCGRRCCCSARSCWPSRCS